LFLLKILLDLVHFLIVIYGEFVGLISRFKHGTLARDDRVLGQQRLFPHLVQLDDLLFIELLALEKLLIFVLLKWVHFFVYRVSRVAYVLSEVEINDFDRNLSSV